MTPKKFQTPVQRKSEFTHLGDDDSNDNGKLMCLLMFQQLAMMKMRTRSFFIRIWIRI